MIRGILAFIGGLALLAFVLAQCGVPVPGVQRPVVLGDTTSGKRVTQLETERGQLQQRIQQLEQQRAAEQAAAEVGGQVAEAAAPKELAVAPGQAAVPGIPPPASAGGRLVVNGVSYGLDRQRPEIVRCIAYGESGITGTSQINVEVPGDWVLLIDAVRVDGQFTSPTLLRVNGPFSGMLRYTNGAYCAGDRNQADALTARRHEVLRGFAPNAPLRVHQ